MANNVKKISINAFEAAVNGVYTPTETIEWRGLSVVVKHNLTLREMVAFVKSVVENCFGQDDAAYMPEIKDFAIRSGIVEYYTNITLPSNVEKRYDLLYHSDMLETVMQQVDKAQFDAIIDAIEEKTAHLAQANIEAITKQMNELYAAIENIQTSFGNLFSDINADDIKGMVSALSNGALDESKIVEAYLDKKYPADKTK